MKMKKSKSQTVRSGARMKRGARNGRRDGGKSIDLERNKNGVINGKKRLVLG